MRQWRRATVATPGEWQCKTGGVQRLAVENGPNIFQMILVTKKEFHWRDVLWIVKYAVIVFVYNATRMSVCLLSQATQLRSPVLTAIGLVNGKPWEAFITARRHAERGVCRRRVSVCLSVSITLWYCIKTAKHRIIMLDDSPMTLVFWCQRSSRNSNRIIPYGGDKCRCGGLKFVTFDEKRAITRKRYKIDV